MFAKDIKPGMIVNYARAPCLIETVQVQSPSARGAATLYKYRARNLITKQKIDIALKGADSLELADFARRPARYMYADATHAHFLDQGTYETHSLPKQEIAEELPYLTEELEGIHVLIYNEQAVGIQLPAAVELAIVDCAPGVRGDSATGRNKPATLQTGLVVQVPEYLNPGEKIKVDTRTGQFLSRA
ncbi:MAG: elongation factor P [Thermoguttaceae bacterium]